MSGRILNDFMPTAFDPFAISRPSALDVLEQIASAPQPEMPRPLQTFGSRSRQDPSIKEAIAGKGNLDLTVVIYEWTPGYVVKSAPTVSIDLPALTGTTGTGEYPHTADGQHKHDVVKTDYVDLQHTHTYTDASMELQTTGVSQSVNHYHGISWPSEEDGAHKHEVHIPASESPIEGTIGEVVTDVVMPSLTPTGDRFMMIWRDGGFVGEFPENTEYPFDPNTVRVKKTIGVLTVPDPTLNFNDEDYSGNLTTI